MDEMKPKAKPIGPSLRDKLSQSFLETLEADFRAYGASVIETMRQTDPTRYAELAGKLIMSAEPPIKGIDFNDANSMEELGLKLLQSIGFSDPDEDSIQAAIKANNDFVAKLQAIRARAEGDIH
jgi:hypothetical protein